MHIKIDTTDFSTREGAKFIVVLLPLVISGRVMNFNLEDKDHISKN